MSGTCQRNVIYITSCRENVQKEVSCPWRTQSVREWEHDVVHDIREVFKKNHPIAFEARST